ncbi:MAG: hypothetical protein A3B17_02935 [Candidatus Yanofskybacteria bacterium RIFCSPLOWO2_01_FULL_45_72]|nr:MAG: hypothetical protein A3B17_02935 [Candidatus Yanofskybacteria bacterium RIFCSPLOWO2_01_FULL_45_72]
MGTVEVTGGSGWEGLISGPGLGGIAEVKGVGDWIGLTTSLGGIAGGTTGGTGGVLGICGGRGGGATDGSGGGGNGRGENAGEDTGAVEGLTELAGSVSSLSKSSIVLVFWSSTTDRT